MLSRDALEMLAVLKKKIANTNEKIDQILPGYTYKGSVANKTDLPNDATVGDLYTVKNENYAQYAWDGEDWITPQFPTITTEQVDELF